MRIRMRGSLLSFSHLSVLYFSYKLSFEGGVLTPPDLDDDLRWGVNNPSRSKKAANQSFGTPLLEAANHADIGFHQTPIIDMRHANHPVFTTGKAPAQEAQDAGIKVVFFYDTSILTQKNVKFLIVKNHNIPDDKIRNALEAAKTFFSLPTEEKMKVLQILNANTKWINAPPIDETFPLNLGNQFARWTNDVFKSTVHRAINRTVIRRYSIPLFFGSDYNGRMEPMVNCVSANRPQRSEVVTACDYVKSRLEAVYAATV
ncbi:Clavaminate synthase-like protein [Rickenella mellea]|uniref:Clavaminate synthase-like protein n=1 Tax=Rickenella mellea TaxID=50990 RepID=A0A4Y7PW92_9AGAM|nr:Clavaminate synthase-like protein [Rickenella mellea]